MPKPKITVKRAKIPAKATPKAGRMNGTERAFSEFLEGWKHRGIILGWWFEAMKFRLADTCFYTPDFMVQRSDGEIEFYEVKGFWRDDARVKIKVAASLYPFRFVAVKKVKNGWAEEEIKT